MLIRQFLSSHVKQSTWKKSSTKAITNHLVGFSSGNKEEEWKSMSSTIFFRKFSSENNKQDVNSKPSTSSSSTSSSSTSSSSTSRTYHWITDEAEDLIAKAYKRHLALADQNRSFPPSLDVKDLEKLEEPFHYKPVDFVDRFTLKTMKIMRIFTHLFFREKYDHHAVVLETVAAVPGIVASAARHLRSLRKMQRDNGWINPLQEEAENERMHLLIWMQVTQPTKLERALVVLAQGVYLHFYILFYLTSPRAAHRFVGYLEEEAHAAYTDFLKSIDQGKIENGPAPSIAIKYYNLPQNATLRDVVLHVRADECMHRDFNHMLGCQISNQKSDSPPEHMKEMPKNPASPSTLP